MGLGLGITFYGGRIQILCSEEKWNWVVNWSGIFTVLHSQRLWLLTAWNWGARDKSAARRIDLKKTTMVKRTLQSSSKMYSTDWRRVKGIDWSKDGKWYIQKAGIYTRRLSRNVAEDPIYVQFCFAGAFAFSMFSLTERSKSVTLHRIVARETCLGCRP